MKMLRAILFSITLAAAVGPPPAHAHSNVRPGFNLFSAQQDVEIGQQSAAQVERQMPLLNEPESVLLVERVGARLAAQAPGTRFPYRFKVVNLSDVNAFALPGGYVYVNRGLIENVRTEGELAGVLAHEIAHVALRHPTHQASNAYAAQAGLGLIERLLGGRSGTSTRAVIQSLGGFGLNTLFLRFSRNAESEADAVGAQIMARAGYDPADMARFFQHMRAEAGQDPSKLAVFFSSHPSPADREAHIRQEARLYSIRRAAPVGGLRIAQVQLKSLPPARSMKSLA